MYYQGFVLNRLSRQYSRTLFWASGSQNRRTELGNQINFKKNKVNNFAPFFPFDKDREKESSSAKLLQEGHMAPRKHNLYIYSIVGFCLFRRNKLQYFAH
uniref:Uncharacterized protein n=1 Tax=Cacopsylla melanoneura TaxID=428564 RepID=A0A8D9EDG8_9HEMI